MKKFMMAAVALICMTMMSVTLTACSSDNDSKLPTTYNYVANGSLTVQLIDADAAGVSLTWNAMMDYYAAINEAAPEPYTEEKDAAVKNACDAVYAKHQAMTGVKISGTVEIIKSVNSENKGVIWSKTY